MSEVSLHDITKAFDSTVAVDGVSLTIDDGEVLGVVGPSGCGKTTMLRLVAGFETATDGTICYDGEDVTHVPPENRSVGLVFQSYALFDNMSVLRNVTFGPKMHGVGKDERRERAHELLDLLDIEELAERVPRSLSGGQQQRVGLARALAIEPRLLLLDEPMTGLDAKLKRTLRRELGDLLDDLGVTTLYVTHDQGQAMSMCDRIAVMNEGSLQQVGTPAELYETPANAFVADFLGTSNLLSATAADGRLDFGFTTLPLNGQSATGEVTAVARSEAFTLGGPISATVVHRSYLGRHVRVVAELPTGEDVTLDLDRPSSDIGDTLALSLDAERLHLLEQKSDDYSELSNDEPSSSDPREEPSHPL